MKRSELENYLGQHVEVTLFDDFAYRGILRRTEENIDRYGNPKHYFCEGEQDNSGKITGDILYKAKFKTAAEYLKAKGYEVINPAETVLPNSKLATWEDYMLVSFAFLDKADEIYMLNDWKESPGACAEYGFAIAKGMKIRQEGVHHEQNSIL